MIPILLSRRMSGSASHPATVATGELQLRLEAKIFANPSDRIGHLAVIRCAKIVNLRSVLRFASRIEVHHMQDRGDAILNIKIALSLAPIAENAKAIGVLHQLTIEIERVPVGVAFTQNGNEPEDITFEAESLTICLD